ncbi:hypothetical protein [Abyssalbus ytuae]|uniref:Lipoprotein n=1 Tax=Abyssalbus ytuae TaxID=2926907 RepID=A0A9E7CSE2_9FLAO|nr:hypothetical protein [Abyssalbus ytuae]UOB16136.1 hypothetical protein MQE35_10345 [Abyssalbus ytuae]
MRNQKIKQILTAVFPVLVFTLLVSCKGDKQKEEVTSEIDMDESLEQASSEINETQPEKTYHTLVAGFIECKSNATERSHCRNEITKIISEKYNIDDFRDGTQSFVIYDSIQPLIKRSNKWKSIGLATNQEVLDKALEHTNKGGLSLIIDTSNSYGHVVMILPGESYPSGSWNLKLPPVLSLLNPQPESSFFGKPLSFAFKRSDDLQVFIRE